MKQYIGYIEKESPLRYEVKENEINKPLPVYATDEKIKRCKCGSKLVLLYYEASTNGKKEIHGKKCPECGNNYFSYRQCMANESAFEVSELYVPNSNEEELPDGEVFIELGTYIYITPLHYVHECNGSLEKKRCRLIDNNGCEIVVTLNHCKNCGKFFVSEKKYQRLGYRFSKYIFQQVGEEKSVNLSIDTHLEREKSSPDNYYMINREEPYCRRCGGNLEIYHQRITTPEGKKRRIAVRKCVVCGTKHMSYGTYSACGYGNIINSDELNYMRTTSELRHEIKVKKKELDKLEKKFTALMSMGKGYVPLNTDNSTAQEKKDIVIDVYFKLNNSCIRKKHDIQTVSMEVHNTRGFGKRIVNVFHCRQCDKYWINYEAIEDLLNKRFYPDFKYRIVKESWEGLKPVSELMMYGYNVKEGELTEKQRQLLLKELIDKGLMTKDQIIRNIQSKVDFNGKKSGNENAKKRWIDDIKYVSQYTVGNVQEIHGRFEI